MSKPAATEPVESKPARLADELKALAKSVEQKRLADDEAAPGADAVADAMRICTYAARVKAEIGQYTAVATLHGANFALIKTVCDLLQKEHGFVTRHTLANNQWTVDMGWS